MMGGINAARWCNGYDSQPSSWFVEGPVRCFPHPAPTIGPPHTPLAVHTGFVAAFTEGPIDFYKSQIQVQIIRAKQIPDYKREYIQI